MTGAAQGRVSLIFRAAPELGGLVTGAWLAADKLALGGAAASGDLGQGGLVLLSYHFLGTYYVLGALCGFSNLNFTVIVLQAIWQRGEQRQRAVCRAPGWVQRRQVVTTSQVFEEAQRQAGLQGTRVGAGTGRQALCLEVSTVSAPTLLRSGT